MQDFIDRLHQATPRLWVTHAVIAVNVVVYLLSVLIGLDPITPDPRALIEIGGNWQPLTVRQPWRLISSTVLHAGIVHLAFNMWALYQLGSIAERFYGNVQFALLYLLAGLFGSLVSLLFSGPQTVSVGASGAVFGVAGAILAVLFTKPHGLPPALLTRMRLPLLLFVGFSLFMGFSTDFIDNSAHIGGLVSGFVLAWIMAERFDWEKFHRRAVQRAMLAIACAALAAAVIWRFVPAPVV